MPAKNERKVPVPPKSVPGRTVSKAQTLHFYVEGKDVYQMLVPKGRKYYHCISSISNFGGFDVLVDGNARFYPYSKVDYVEIVEEDEKS